MSKCYIGLAIVAKLAEIERNSSRVQQPLYDQPDSPEDLTALEEMLHEVRPLTEDDEEFEELARNVRMATTDY